MHKNCRDLVYPLSRYCCAILESNCVEPRELRLHFNCDAFLEKEQTEQRILVGRV
jgi:hypothetical protein